MKVATVALAAPLSPFLRSPPFAHAGHVPGYLIVPIVVVAVLVAWQAVKSY